MMSKTIVVFHLVFMLTANLYAAKPNIIFIVTDDYGYNDLEATDLRDES